MANVESIRPFLEPLRKSIVVRRAPAEAFEIFTARIGSWWPRDRFSIHQAESATCGMEPRVGGEVFEVSTAGARERWGTVVAWEPPHRMVMTWHPGRPPSTAQEVEVRFMAVDEGTRVDLEHRGWNEYGEGAEEARGGYESGWAVVFDRCFMEACA
jgi:uncharacterized protein YndB with AHSA1/START domain